MSLQLGPPPPFPWLFSWWFLPFPVSCWPEAQGYSSLQEAGVRLVPHHVCRRAEVYGNHVTDGMLCAGLGGCADACQVGKDGDDGARFRAEAWTFF